jgi:hypothetical protein
MDGHGERDRLSVMINEVKLASNLKVPYSRFLLNHYNSPDALSGS